MIVLDTCILIFDALNPKKLTSRAKKSISYAQEKGQLCCSDISLWEIAMLIQKKRLDPGTDAQTFLKLILQAREIQILEINIEIAALATTHLLTKHYDPADRIIAATALHHQADLITCDQHLREIPNLSIIW